MAERNRDITIRVKVKDDGSVVLQSIGDKGKKSLEAIDRQGQKANETMRAMDGLVAAVTTGFIGLAAVNVGRGLLETASSFEKLETRLTTIQGSSAAAKKSMAWITEFTAQTPYELAQVSDAFVKLNAYGFDAIKWMPMLGDTASSMGKGLDEAVEMFADATTGEFERLKEFGVRAKQEGDTATFSWVENGKQMTVSAQKTQAGISEALDQVFARFEGGMKAQATTWEGMTSNMADAWTAFKLDVMSAGIFDELKGGIEEVLVTAKRLKDDGTLKEWAGGITNAIFIIEAEAIRLAMLLDKIGGTMTMIPMGIFAPGAALGNDNSIAQFEKWAQRNIELEERYKAGDKALQDLADRQVAAQNQVATAVQHTTDVINTQTTATGTATTKTKKQIDEHEKYLDQITAKYLPLKAEAQEVEKAHQALAEQLAKGVITGNEYAVAMDNLYKSQTHVVEAQKKAAEAAKASHQTWQDQQEIIESLYQTSLPEYGRALAAIEEKYTNLEDAIRQMVLSGQMAADVAATLQNDLAISKGIDLAAANRSLNAFVTAHEDSADKVLTVWDSATNGLNSGLDEWVRNGEMSAQSVKQAFTGAIRGIVADWGRGIAAMDATSAKMQSIGGTAALYSTIAGSDSGYGGLLSGGVGIANELFNPGAYAKTLATLQAGLTSTIGTIGGSTVVNGIDLAANFGAGGVLNNSAGNFISNLSPTQFGAGVAGVGTFAIDLLSGKDFGQSAAEGAASGIGYALGSMTPLGPIGGMIGSFLATALTGSLFGDDEDEFSLNELNPHIDSRYSRGAGLDAPDWTEPDGTRPTTTYLNAIDQLQNQLETRAQQLGDSMSETAAAAFFGALETIDLTPDADGRWGVSQTQEALTEILSNYGVKLNDSLSVAIKAALPAIAEEMLGDGSPFGLLTETMQDKIRELVASDGFGLEQLTQLRTYFGQISQAMAPIDEIIATNGLTEYELSLRAANQQIVAWRDQLRAAGIDLEKDTKLREAWGIALEKVNAAERQRAARLELDQANDALGIATTVLNNAAAAERNRLTAAHTGLVADLNSDLATVNATIGDLGRTVDSIHRAKLSMDLGTTDFARDRYSAAKETMTSVLQAVRAGDFSSLSRLDDSLNILARPTMDLYSSMEEYQRDYWQNYIALGEIESLTGDQLSVEERMADSLRRQLEVETDGFNNQISLLDQQLNALMGIDAGIVSLAAAMAGYAAAKNTMLTATTKFDNSAGGLSPDQRYLLANPDVAAAVTAGQFKSGYDHYAAYGYKEERDYEMNQEQRYLLDNPDVAAAVAAGDFASGAEHWLQYGKKEDRVYGFASGGSFTVGGAGGIDNLTLPGLRVTAGEMVHVTRPDSMQTLARTNAELLAEMRALRDDFNRLHEENRRLNYQIAKNTGTVADNTTNWEFNKLNVQVVT